jgi:hypothetical protein
MAKLPARKTQTRTQKAASAVRSVGRMAGRKTSSQIAAARRNIAKARQAVKRKAGGTAALRLKMGAKRIVSKVKARATVLRARVRKAVRG